MKTPLGLLCIGFFLIAQLSAQSPKNSPCQWRNVKEVYTGYAALVLGGAALQAEKNRETDFWQEQYTSKYVAASYDLVKVNNLLNPDKFLRANYQFSSEGFSNQIGEFIYIGPMLRQLYDHMIAKQGEQIVLRRSESSQSIQRYKSPTNTHSCNILNHSYFV